MRIRPLPSIAVLSLLAFPSAADAAHRDKHGSKFQISLRTGQEDQEGSLREIVSFGKSVRLAEGEKAKNVVVIGGSAAIKGEVEEDVVVVAGQALVDGTVDGDVVAIGSVVLSSGAEVQGDAVAVGGSLSIEPGATVGGDRTEVGVGFLRTPAFLGDSRAAEALRRWIVEGLFWLRPFPPRVGWAWAAAGVLLAFYVGLALVFPAGMGRCVSVLEERPLSALLTGILAALLVGPASLMLAATVVGILAIPFLALLMIAAAVFGKAVMSCWVGRGVGKRFEAPALDNGAAAVALGTGLVFAVYAVPVLGLVAWVLTAAFGAGAVLLAGFDALRSETGGSAPVEPEVLAGAGPIATGSGGPAPEAQAPPAQARAMQTGAAARAGFWPRLGAVCVDALLVGFVGAATPLPPFSLVLWLVYQVGMWTWKSTTVGGIVFGLKGVRLDGRPMDFGVALVRHLASYLSAMALFLGFLWAGWDPEGRTWHDKLAGTIVVKVPKGEPLI
ncbi:MAG: RDD family protein [Elusimicrobia bacterium]|nr:RDD family protein [Elusimicrobiota bacterium]